MEVPGFPDGSPPRCSPSDPPRTCSRRPHCRNIVVTARYVPVNVLRDEQVVPGTEQEQDGRDRRIPEANASPTAPPSSRAMACSSASRVGSRLALGARPGSPDPPARRWRPGTRAAPPLPWCGSVSAPWWRILVRKPPSSLAMLSLSPGVRMIGPAFLVEYDRYPQLLRCGDRRCGGSVPRDDGGECLRRGNSEVEEILLEHTAPGIPPEGPSAAPRTGLSPQTFPGRLAGPRPRREARRRMASGTRRTADSELG